MKSKTTKGIAVLLACFLGMAAVGCSGDNDSSSKNSDAAEVCAATLPVETDAQGEAVTDASGNEVLASGATDFMVKEIEFTWGNQNGSSDSSQDATEATDSNGNAVTTAAGGSSIPQHRQTATLPMVAATMLLTATVLLMATAKSLPLMQQ